METTDIIIKRARMATIKVATAAFIAADAKAVRMETVAISRAATMALIREETTGTIKVAITKITQGRMATSKVATMAAMATTRVRITFKGAQMETTKVVTMATSRGATTELVKEGPMETSMAVTTGTSKAETARIAKTYLKVMAAPSARTALKVRMVPKAKTARKVRIALRVVAEGRWDEKGSVPHKPRKLHKDKMGLVQLGSKPTVPTRPRDRISRILQLKPTLLTALAAGPTLPAVKTT